MRFRGIKPREALGEVRTLPNTVDELILILLDLISSVRKHEQLTRSLRKMERTLDTVLRTINNPGLTSLASGMVSRSPSPSRQAAGAQALLESPSPPQQSLRSPSTHVEGSPRLHSLPDNALNPLGLLAEASLSNRRTNSSHSAARSPSSAPKQNVNEEQNVGVASEAYFQPGEENIKMLLFHILNKVAVFQDL